MLDPWAQQHWPMQVQEVLQEWTGSCKGVRPILRYPELSHSILLQSSAPALGTTKA